MSILCAVVKRRYNQEVSSIGRIPLHPRGTHLECMPASGQHAIVERRAHVQPVGPGSELHDAFAEQCQHAQSQRWRYGMTNICMP